MTPARRDSTELARMEEARRQTRRQLDVIERQILRHSSVTVPSQEPRRRCFDHGGSLLPASFARRYRETLVAIALERQPEIDALSRQLARQDRAVEALRMRLEVHLAAAA